MCLSGYDYLEVKSEKKKIYIYIYHINIAKKMFWFPNFAQTIPHKVLLISWQQ